MKIAVPTNNNMVDEHFGHCDHFVVFTVEDGKIESSEDVPAGEGCGCKSNIAETLRSMGVSLMLAGNMGEGAVYVLDCHGIDVIRGCSGNIADVVNDFIKGTLSDSGTCCDGHEGCNHEH